jgi:hypothetical protein
MFGLAIVGICSYAAGVITVIGIIVQRNLRGDRIERG